VTRLIGYLYTNGPWLHFTDTHTYTHTETSVLSLLQSPLAVSWQRNSNSLTELRTPNITHRILSSQPPVQNSTVLTLSLAYNISAWTTFHCCSPTVALLRICCLATDTCLPSRCPGTVAVYRAGFNRTLLLLFHNWDIRFEFWRASDCPYSRILLLPDSPWFLAWLILRPWRFLCCWNMNFPRFIKRFAKMSFINRHVINILKRILLCVYLLGIEVLEHDT
jgi:hypothetical protein